MENNPDQIISTPTSNIAQPVGIDSAQNMTPIINSVRLSNLYRILTLVSLVAVGVFIGFLLLKSSSNPTQENSNYVSSAISLNSISSPLSQLFDQESTLSYSVFGKPEDKTTANPVQNPTTNPTTNPQPTPTVPSNNEPPIASFQPETLRVMEVRYIPDGNLYGAYNPDDLSRDLVNLIQDSSSFHKYKSPSSKPFLNVNVVSVINRNTARPNPTGYYIDTYLEILNQDNLCQQIRDLDIDQLWLWVNPVVDTGPGVEYVVSSKYFRYNAQYVTSAFPPLCGDDTPFVMMGFDYTRTADLALHSWGHLFEGVLGNLQDIDFFWYNFAGNNSTSFPLAERCGNVHYPPNGSTDYDYGNKSYVNTVCENWAPGIRDPKVSINCDRWGCDQRGYLLWWFQNMPNVNNNLWYNGYKVPNWFDFFVNFDYKIERYYNDYSYHMSRLFIENQARGSCHCEGADFYDNPVTIDVCGGRVVGRDASCYQCEKSGWIIVSNYYCRNL